ncbi:MAG: hypothetical protein K6A40_07475 [Solobacterium sp.]|nr:hypothetical protein [Solobacterium sp.]
MKELDSVGSRLCSYQADIFSGSLELQSSSRIFLRRFFRSKFARKLDDPGSFLFSYDVEDCYDSIHEEFGETDYGKVKLSETVLHWLGYITRYICYTREFPSILLYKTIPLDMFIDHYEVYHTQSEEWVIARILELSKLDESVFDKKKREKAILTSLWL